MNHSGKAQIRHWAETWKRAGVALEEIKRRELQAFDYAANQGLVDAMLRWACQHQRPRASTGLIEQQRLFMKLGGRKKLTHGGREAD